MVKSELKIQSRKPSMATSTSTSPSLSSSSNRIKKYKGVRMRSWGSWVSEIRAPNQKTRIWLGSYSTAEAAARAYDAALLCLKGSSANLNFPITSSHYIPDTVLSPKSIQRVAAAAANSFLDNNAAAAAAETAPVSLPSPPLPSPSPSSSSSMSYNSSSPISEQLDVYDDVSLIDQSFAINYTNQDDYNYSWYNFDDHDHAAASSSFDCPLMIDDFFEGDFRLWSFAE